MQWLFLFVLILAVLAAVGHGIWLLVAAILRAMFGVGETPTSALEGVPCPRCGGQIPLGAPGCPRCGLNQSLGNVRELRDLEATERQINRFRKSGTIEDSAWEALNRHLAERRQQLTGRWKPELPELPIATPLKDPTAIQTERPAPLVPALHVPETASGAFKAAESVAAPIPAPAPERLAAPPQPPPIPRPPRRTMSDMLAGFMEERNILWGELVGGMLIVGCSIALVITLWHSLEAIPYFPFLVFAAVTVGLFAAGEYTLHHWKLATTSRGLLLISLLLVPLNLLVLAEPSREAASGVLDVGVRMAALLGFALLIRVAAGDLIGVNVLPGPADRRWLLTLAVLGSAGSQLLIRRFSLAEHPEMFILLAWLPAVCHAAAIGAVVTGILRRLRGGDWPAADESRLRPAYALLVFLGVATFALSVALGFLLTRSGELSVALHRLAPPVAVAGAAVLAAGLVVQQHLAGDAGAVRTAGSGVAMAGVSVMLASVALAWPLPSALLLVCILNGIVLTAAALRGGLLPAQGAAIPCFGLAYLVAFHLIAGRLSWSEGVQLRPVLFGLESGTALVGLVALLAIVAEFLARIHRSELGAGYALGAGGWMLFSLALVTNHGMNSPGTAAIVYGIYGIGVLAMQQRWRVMALGYIGLGLLVAGTLWGLQWRWPFDMHWWSLIIAAESLVCALAALIIRRTDLTSASGQLRAACRDVAATTVYLALGMALFTPGFPVLLAHSGTMALLAASALVLATVFRQPMLTYAGSALALVAFYLYFVHDIGKDHFETPFVVALLAHATITLVPALLVRRMSARSGEPIGDPALILYGQPLYHGAQITSAATVPALLLALGAQPLPLALNTAWLGTLWLVMASVESSPAWFTACQSALSISVLFVASDWIQRQSWFRTKRFLFEPRELLAYGIGLGLLGFVWLAARVALRRTSTVKWWDSPKPRLDHLVLGGLVLGQMALVSLPVMLGVGAELGRGSVEVRFIPSWYEQFFGPRAWTLAALVVVLLLATVWQRGVAFGGGHTIAATLGLIGTGVTIAMLSALPHEAELATASALRWNFAWCFLVGSAVVWLRRPVARAATALGIRTEGETTLSQKARDVLCFLALAVVVLTVITAVPILNGEALAGPAANSIFALMGWVPSILIPLLYVAGGLAGHGVRDRSPGHVFAGGLILNLAATVVVGYQQLGAHGLDWLAPLVQANVLVCGGVALAWQTSRPRPLDCGPGPLLRLQSLLGLTLNTLFLMLPLGMIFVAPEIAHPDIVSTGRAVGWLALGLAAIAAYNGLRLTAPARVGHIGCLTLASACVLDACLAAEWDSRGWLSYHVLVGAWSVLGLLLAMHAAWPLTTRFFTRPATRPWTDWLGALIVLFTLRGCFADPYRPYFPAAALLVVSMMATALAVCFRHSWHVYASGLLLNGVGLLFWLSWGHETLTNFVWTNVIGLSIGTVLWSGLERALTVQETGDEHGIAIRLSGFMPYAHFAACLAFGLAALLIMLDLVGDVSGNLMHPMDALGWTALASVAWAMAASLWDRRAGFALPGLYGWGLLMIGAVLHSLGYMPENLGWTAGLVLAGFVLLTSAIVRLPNLPTILRLPPREPTHWFLQAQATVACAVLALSVWMCLDFAARTDRLGGPLAILLLVGAAILLTRNGNEPIASSMRFVALSLAVMVVAEVAWALPEPIGPAVWLHRHGLLVTAVAAAASLYGIGFGFPRRTDWTEQARRLSPIVSVLAVAILLVLLVQETLQYDRVSRQTAMQRDIAGVVALAVGLLVANAFRSATVPGRDPLGMSEHGRTVYVYAAEVLLVLLFLHLRLTVPELFHGWLAHYWSLIVMAIAFAGTGLGEYFERRRLRVLAGPLQRTGVFLPLVPLLSFWVRPTERLAIFEGTTWPENLGAYSTLWLLVALLYALIALTRKSFAFALLAALAGNSAVWSLLAYHDQSLLVHPQLWLIPLGLIVLVAEKINRERLQPGVSEGLRYFGILIIYISSTADHFIAGVGNSVVLPLELALLSVMGVFAGILFRVRAFLFLGVGFLALDVFTMIWHAAVNQRHTWVWWVCGIILGAAILALFALFEKRRDDMLGLLDKVKRWD